LIPRRRHKRLIKRIEVEFCYENKNYRGIASNFSLQGLFIRTVHPFVADTKVDILLNLPDGSKSNIKGVVKNATKTKITSLRNGMGIELTEKDTNYINFIISFSNDSRDNQNFEGSGTKPASLNNAEIVNGNNTSVFIIVECPRCRVKNKVNKSKISFTPKCGQCGSLLSIA
jgi:Tfp pilus assembly protein PilZ/ribosomal protein S27E